MSRLGPRSPDRIRRMISALSAALPPCRSARPPGTGRSLRGGPCSSGSDRPAVRATRLGPVVDSSSSPSSPWTTKARDRPELLEHLGHHLRQGAVVHPDDLRRGAGRIGQGTENVEDRADPDLSAGEHHELHGLVEQRRIAESDPDLVHAPPHALGGQIQPHAQRLHDVRAAAQAAHGPVAVLRHRDSRARHHEGGGRGDVEGPGRVAAGAAGVHQHLPVGPGQRRLHPGSGLDRRDLLAHHAREPDQLLDRLPLHPKRGEKRGDLGVRRVAGHDGVHDGEGLVPGQVIRSTTLRIDSTIIGVPPRPGALQEVRQQPLACLREDGLGMELHPSDWMRAGAARP